MRKEGPPGLSVRLLLLGLSKASSPVTAGPCEQHRGSLWAPAEQAAFAFEYAPHVGLARVPERTCA